MRFVRIAIFGHDSVPLGLGNAVALFFASLSFSVILSDSVAWGAPPEVSRLQALTHPTPEQEAFFESKVRPVLVARCFRCHSDKQQKGGVRLDSAEALLGKSDDEALLKPGHPETGRLMEVISYQEEPKMPPGGKLPDAESQILREWIRRGAPFPSSAPAPSLALLSSPEGVVRAKRTLWSLQAVRSPVPAAVKNRTWAKTPIDQFILATLEANGLTPSSAADRRTLLRRLSFDLIGLPPTYADVQAFENDHSPQAVEIVVDRLLASPHYGERWSRHWLDVARYSDTKGYVFTEERHYPFSYTYRDYVVEAFNEDLPFDRFILEQLAADQLELGKNHSALAAMGFLTVGRRFSNNANDIIDDRIDVVSRGLMGLSVTCARCHDHKFDPIPTEDYYSLHGVFASSIEPADLPLLGNAPRSAAYQQFESKLQQLENARNRFLEAKRAEVQDQFRLNTGAYLAAAWQARKKNPADERRLTDARGLRPILVRRWLEYLKRMADSPDPVFLAWEQFSKLPEKEFSGRSPDVVAKLKALSTAPEAKGRINAVIQQAFLHQPPKSMRDVAAQYGTLLASAEQRWKKLLKESPAAKQPSALPEREWEELRQTLYRKDSPGDVADIDMKRLLDRAARGQLTKLQNRIEKLRASSPAAPPRGMVLNDAPHPVEPVIFIRGNPGRPGKQVSRHFLQAIGDFGAKSFVKGSGRLELAEDIASPRNPLTARVIVNRVWMHHFGAGIVRTPSDFGVRGSPPTHPDLLDYLASQFMRDGWSLKKLHRQILLSAVYQQASVPRPEDDVKDPENKLLARMNPTRLEFEPMRDSWLAVAGNLDFKIGGQGFEIQTAGATSRRSLYAVIDRQDLPQLFRTFDFASPDVSTAQRSQTTIPQQALFAMNSSFLTGQACALARSNAGRDAAEQVRLLYRRVYARDPSPAEVQSAVTFVNSSTVGGPADDVASAWQYGYGTLDLSAKRVRDFHPFPLFVDRRWGGANLPDSKFGWAHLTAEGGHPGKDAEHSVIRRWVSPIAGEIEVRGTLHHPADKGDGVRGWIVSSRVGTLKEWSVRHGSRETTIAGLTVQPGETLDFVVDCLKTPDYDGFTWAPIIKTKQFAGASTSLVQLWHSKNDFSGPAPPRLNPWEQLAQALLISNEFVFVD